jgi:hypothetical protein
VFRFRVTRPEPLDLQGIADAVVRNNMGVGSLELLVRGRVQGGELVVADTGQRFSLRGAPPSSTKPWVSVLVHGWQPGERVELEWRGEMDAPGVPNPGT